MKKFAVVLLALLLLALTPCAALASEMYDLYGPMEEWEEETWLECEEWSDEQWDDYWLGEEEAYEQEYREYSRAAKLEMGCPDPEGVNVKLNQAFLLFPEEKPQLVDGGVYLPVKAFLSAAGIKASLSYDEGSRSVTATLADGATLYVCADDDTIVITRPGQEQGELYSYYEPLLLDGHMYVEEWDLLRFLGWDSYWDYSYDILYVVDPEPLIAAIDKDFTTINRLFKGGQAPDMNQSYQFTGSFTLSGALYGEENNDTISAAVSYSGIQKGLDLDMSFAIQLDLKQMQDSIFSGLDEEDWRIIKAVGAGKGRVIMNSAQGAIYVQSNLLSLFDNRLSATDWLKLDYPLEELDMLLAGDMVQEQLKGLSLGRLIYQSCQGGYYYYRGRDVYARTLEKAKLWQALLGDANFSQTRQSGYDVYTLSADNEPITGLSLPGADLLGLFGGYGYGYDEDPVELSGQLRFREKAGQVEDIELNATAQTGGPLPISYILTVSGDKKQAQGSMEIKGRYVGKLLFSAAYEQNPTDEAPAAAPPEGSRVVDWEDIDPWRVYTY